MLQYNENLFPTYREYLVKLIESVLGERIENRFSADWGGLDVWSLDGDNFEGHFIVIDDILLIAHINRLSTDEGNEDTEINLFDCSNLYGTNETEKFYQYICNL